MVRKKVRIAESLLMITSLTCCWLYIVHAWTHVWYLYVSLRNSPAHQSRSYLTCLSCRQPGIPNWRGIDWLGPISIAIRALVHIFVILDSTGCNYSSMSLLQSQFSLRGLTQWGRDQMDAIFKRIFVNENLWIPIKISLKFVPKGSINNIPALVRIMAWRRLGDKPLSEPMMVNSSSYICVTRPQWVKIRDRDIMKVNALKKFVLLNKPGLSRCAERLQLIQQNSSNFEEIHNTWLSIRQ